MVLVAEALIAAWASSEALWVNSMVLVAEALIAADVFVAHDIFSIWALKWLRSMLWNREFVELYIGIPNAAYYQLMTNISRYCCWYSCLLPGLRAVGGLQGAITSTKWDNDKKKGDWSNVLNPFRLSIHLYIASFPEPWSRSLSGFYSCMIITCKCGLIEMHYGIHINTPALDSKIFGRGETAFQTCYRRFGVPFVRLPGFVYRTLV